MSDGVWAALALLGAFHGLNPGMGWLFAVALGLQAGRLAAVVRALPPIALGHLVSVAAVVAVVGAAQRVLPALVLRWLAAATLVTMGAWLLVGRRTHPRWVGMRVDARDLVLWSALMSSAHGAGLMLVPVVLRLPPAQPELAAHGHAHALAGALLGVAPGVSPGSAALAVAVHTAAMLTTMAVVAVLVYRVLGLALLRRAWVNVDLLWGAALVVAGAATVAI